MRKKDLEFEIEKLKRENEKLRDASKIPELEAKLHRATVRLWLEKSKNNDYMKAIKLREGIIESTKASGIEIAKQLAITEKALELACEEIGVIEAKFGSAYIRANGYLLDYFKTEAKEMLENE